MFRCVVSGSGKIAMHVLEKLIAYGAVPITVSGDYYILPVYQLSELEFFVGYLYLNFIKFIQLPYQPLVESFWLSTIIYHILN